MNTDLVLRSIPPADDKVLTELRKFKIIPMNST